METNSIYERLKREHPEMSEAELRTLESIERNSAAVISETGATQVTEQLLELIIRKAQEWLMEKLPEIFVKVAELFAEMLDSLPEWAQKGLKYVGKLVVRYFGGEVNDD